MSGKLLCLSVAVLCGIAAAAPEDPVCEGGSYTCLGVDGMKTCCKCPPGTFQSSKGQSYCNNCAAGRYGTKSGQLYASSCIKCVFPRYQPLPGKSYCENDHAGCDDGSAVQADGKCVPCSPGKYITHPGHAESSPGKCKKCAANHFAASAGSSSCKLCASGKFNDRTGAAYCMWRGKTPILPPRPEDDMTPAEVQCIAGKFKATKNGKAVCTNCPAGKYSGSANVEQCTDCAAGKYNPYAGKNSEEKACLECEGMMAGATFCHRTDKRLTCPAGKYPTKANEKDDNDHSCKVGEDCANIVEACANCPEGMYSTAGSTHCTRCPVGTQATNKLVRSSGAMSWLTGGPQNQGLVVDRDNVAPNAWKEGSDQCTHCPPGSAWHNGICKRCEAGTFQEVAGALHCDKCAPGTWSEVGAAVCTSGSAADHCTGGRSWNPEGNPCTMTCDSRICPNYKQKVGRCECTTKSKPFWDDKAMKCVSAAECDHYKKLPCPEDAEDFTCPDPRPGYHFVSSKAIITFGPLKNNACKKWPCGIEKPTTSCISPLDSSLTGGPMSDGRVESNGWTGPGDGNQWCNEYQCDSNTGKFELVGEKKNCSDLEPSACSHVRCKFVAGSVKVKYDKLEALGTSHRCGHLDRDDPHNCKCTCFS